jgi:hypothetical protein
MVGHVKNATVLGAHDVPPSFGGARQVVQRPEPPTDACFGFYNLDLKAPPFQNKGRIQTRQTRTHHHHTPA